MSLTAHWITGSPWVTSVTGIGISIAKQCDCKAHHMAILLRDSKPSSPSCFVISDMWVVMLEEKGILGKEYDVRNHLIYVSNVQI